jgi:hypothetical protein
MNATLPASVSVPAENLTRLESLVLRQLNRRIHDFRIMPRGEGLVLQGCTSTYYAKQLAQASLMALTDLPILANEIEVR